MSIFPTIKLFVTILSALTLATSLLPSRAAAETAHQMPEYGSNPGASGKFQHDGVEFYYEVYGKGDPVVLIHGNGGSIADWASQIEYFRTKYRVIAMDSRDQGRTGDSSGPITYEKMADDQAALLEHLGIAQANFIGWSDGGIEALLLGMRHPLKVKKIVAMAANLKPDAVYPEVAQLDEILAQQAQAANVSSRQAARDKKVFSLLANEPHIDPKMLSNMTAPTLVLAGDHDLILDTHTLEIFHNLPNAQLGIIPDSTHMVPYDDPERFNDAVERFLRHPFVKKDRIADFLKSLEKIRANQK